MDFIVKLMQINIGETKVNVVINIGFGGMCSLTLIVAKLLGLFPFSWWWTVAPILIAYAVTFAMIVTSIIGLMAVGFDPVGDDDSE